MICLTRLTALGGCTLAALPLESAVNTSASTNRPLTHGVRLRSLIAGVGARRSSRLLLVGGALTTTAVTGTRQMIRDRK